MLVNQKTVQLPKPQKRLWAKRGIKIGAGVLVIAVLLVLSYYAALVIYLGPVTYYRILTNGDSTIYTYNIFPQRPLPPMPYRWLIPLANWWTQTQAISLGTRVAK